MRNVGQTGIVLVVAAIGVFLGIIPVHLSMHNAVADSGMAIMGCALLVGAFFRSITETSGVVLGYLVAIGLFIGGALLVSIGVDEYQQLQDEKEEQALTASTL